MKTCDLHDTIRNVLKGLGKTSDEVAATLAEYGIKGRIEDAHECVLAHYLENRMAALDLNLSILEVDTTGIRFEAAEIDFEYEEEDSVGFYGELKHLEQFVERFDKREWPNLVEE